MTGSTTRTCQLFIEASTLAREGSPEPWPPHSSDSKPDLASFSRLHQAERVMIVVNAFLNIFFSAGIERFLDWTTSVPSFDRPHYDCNFDTRCVMRVEFQSAIFPPILQATSPPKTHWDKSQRVRRGL